MNARKIGTAVLIIAIGGALGWYLQTKHDEQVTRDLQNIPPEEFADSPVLNASLETLQGTVVRIDNETMLIRSQQERTVGEDVFVETKEITALFTSATPAYRLVLTGDGTPEFQPTAITDIAKGDRVIINASEDVSRQATVRIVTLYINAYE